VRKLLLCGVALGAALPALIVSAPAGAADLPMAPPMYRPFAPALAPPCMWCGFYAGINLGGAFDTGTSASFAGSPALAGFFAGNEFPQSVQPNPHGFIGGGQVGFNWQVSPAVVLGVETDFQGSTYKGTSTVTPIPTGALAVFTTQVEQHSNWFGTARGRAGWVPWPNAMIYGTGGLAYGQTEVSLNTFPPGVACTAIFTCANGSATTTRIGWTVGGGIEWMIVPHLTFKAEYLFMDLGSPSVTVQSTSTAAPCTGGICSFTATPAFHENIVRGGFNWVFNGP
jgi:outer membrane immunogenic protein